MILAGHQTMMAKRGVPPPWDYRVAYFEVATGTPRFLIPKIPYWNSNITSQTRVEATNYLRSINVVSAPSEAQTGDEKLCGSLYRFGVGRYGNKWRPAGFTAWPTQPTEQQFPWIADAPVCLEQWKTGYTFTCPVNGKTYTASVSQGNVRITVSGCACGWIEGDNDSSFTAVPVGTRWYREAAECSHTTYGFAYDIIPVVLNGTPYICDRLSGLMISQSGSGTISLGPKVADNYDAITNP